MEGVKQTILNTILKYNDETWDMFYCHQYYQKQIVKSDNLFVVSSKGIFKPKRKPLLAILWAKTRSKV